ncbi:hypothetical protein KZO11_34445 [Streptomyces anulatus]|nr:hypothetical protein [Streptomyces anulatus]QYA98321.1 hypothetical protein KZO11_34445 [Streptomyces anulatus]
MALAVVDRVEARRPATAGSALLAVAGLVSFVWDGAADSAVAVSLAVLGSVGLLVVRVLLAGSGPTESRPSLAVKVLTTDVPEAMFVCVQATVLSVLL